MNKLGFRWYRYVPKDRVKEYSSLGWKSTGALKGDYREYYSEIMEWIGEGDDPPEPADMVANRREYKDRPFG